MTTPEDKAPVSLKSGDRIKPGSRIETMIHSRTVFIAICLLSRMTMRHQQGRWEAELLGTNTEKVSGGFLGGEERENGIKVRDLLRSFIMNKVVDVMCYKFDSFFLRNLLRMVEENI